MENFYLYASVIGIGIGVVIILIVVELTKGKKPAATPAPKVVTQKPSRKPADILAKLGLHLPPKLAIPSAQEEAQQQNLQNSVTITTPETPVTAQAKPEPVIITQAVTESEEYLDLKHKYEKLDVLLKEKSTELEKKDTALAHELRTRKDFNKVKDILEKELKEVKDKCHKLGLELTDSQAETESQKARVNQLGETINKKNKDILESERKIEELTKQVATLTEKTPKQTVATAPEPATTTTISEQPSATPSAAETEAPIAPPAPPAQITEPETPPAPTTPEPAPAPAEKPAEKLPEPAPPANEDKPATT